MDPAQHAYDLALHAAQLAAVQWKSNTPGPPVNAGLANGVAGAALLRAGLYAIDRDDKHLHVIADLLQCGFMRGEGILGLFTGRCGLLFASDYTATISPAAAEIREKLRQYVAHLFSAGRTLVERRPVTDVGDYDVISGMAGILLGHSLAGHSPDVAVEYLIRLCSDAATLLVHRTEPFLPESINLGMAHGLAGILSALSLSSSQTPMRRSAVQNAVSLLSENAIYDGANPLWLNHSYEVDVGFEGMAWCYGTLGVTCALAATGDYLYDSACTHLASSALRGFVRRKRSRNIDELGLCHGLAGVATQLSVLSEKLEVPDAKRKSEELFEECLLRLGDDLRRGECSDLSFLQGASGAALALLTHFFKVVDARWTLAMGLPVSNVAATGMREKHSV